MINLLQIQDDLKNFSEDQLVREMQQPSGTAPQFLVLSELNRRKRVKGEFAARQAQQAPTVAEEVVAAAGVPQSGMMGMSEAMAPASVDSGGIGAMMPQNMKSGGVIRAQSGLPEDEIVDTSFDSDFDTQGGSQMMPMGTNQKLNLTSEDDDVLDIEQELRNRQAMLESDRNFARNMALVQAGLGILASDKPTLAQAVGEGGQQGLTAFTDANKAYQEGLTDVLNARSKLQQARIKATGRGTLDRKGALAAISSYNNDIAAIRKQISDVSTSYEGDPREIPQKLAALEEELNRLRFEQSQLYDAAGIRPRPKIKVADLPSSTKSG